MVEDILLSVVLTTYNRGHLLPRAIQSVLKNDYSRLELIVIDDYSIDDTKNVVDTFSDTRLKYHKMDKNRGVLAARNKGFDIAIGDYIAILDDDDELLPSSLGSLVSAIRAKHTDNIDIFWFDCEDAESNKRSGTELREGIIKFEDYVCGKIEGDFWLVFAAHVLRAQRFDERLRAHESVFWLQLHRNKLAYHFPLVLCKKYREHGVRLCDLDERIKQIPQTTLALSEFLRLFGDELRELCPIIYGQRLSYLGLHQLLNNDFQEGRRSIKKSMKFRKSYKYMLLFFLSFFVGSQTLREIYKKTEEKT